MSHPVMIPRSHWARYLKAVSRRFLEQPLELLVAAPGAPEARVAQGLYLVGVSLEGGRGDALVLQLAGLGRPCGHLSHRIARPVALRRELGSDGELAVLVVEDHEQACTSLEFRDREPPPGTRHHGILSGADRCDHPRCLLAHADRRLLAAQKKVPNSV
jgi:hypothetical protein